MSDDPVDEIPDDQPDPDIKELMQTHDIDQDAAERVSELMDELGVDEDDAVELENEGL